MDHCWITPAFALGEFQFTNLISNRSLASSAHLKSLIYLRFILSHQTLTVGLMVLDVGALNRPGALFVSVAPPDRSRVSTAGVVRRVQW